MEMQYRRLGHSGLQVSVLSFGSWVSFGPQLAGANARDGGCALPMKPPPPRSLRLGVSDFSVHDEVGVEPAGQIIQRVLYGRNRHAFARLAR